MKRNGNVTHSAMVPMALYCGRSARAGGSEGRRTMEQTIFMICMFFGVAAVALIAFTLLAIVLGKVQV